MGRKSNAEIKREKTIKVASLFWAIVLIFILVCAISKSGTIGVISYNILTYVLGNLYPVVMICTIINCFAQFFNHKLSWTTILGMWLLCLALILLSGMLLQGTILDFEQYKTYVTSNFLNAFSKEVQAFNAGIVGHGLYLALLKLVDKGITVTIIIICIVLALFLIVPIQWYKDAFNSIKENAKDNKLRRQEEKRQRQLELELEEKKIQKQREEENLRLAEEMNSEYEEEERKEEVKEIIVPKASKPSMESKSKYFINLDDDEISAKQEEKPTMVDLDLTGEHKVVSLDGAHKTLRVRQTTGAYHFPPQSLFESKVGARQSTVNKNAAKVKGQHLLEILKTFEIEADLINTHIGPSVTKFEIKPETNVKVNRIMQIQDNIKMELAAKDIRIEAPIPGRSAVGIEIPNAETIPVRMGDMINSLKKDNYNVSFALGKDLLGDNVYCDLSKMPHLLIAGATGSGKSVCINSIITSLLMRSHPDCVKLVLVDPKKVEFTPYHDVPHLLWPVITEAKMASLMLQKIVVMMEQRYETFSNAGVRNIHSYNEYVDKYNAELSQGDQAKDKLPFIVVIIDELADLMMIAKNDVEQSIQRITQLARASGIHLVVATQRPSTDVITGLIKSNIPSRISFAVSSGIDSRTVIDQVGAERLLGNGDMLYAPQGENAPIRVQGVYVTDDEISAVTSYVKSQARPVYDDTYYSILNNMNGSSSVDGSATATNEVDPLFDEVVEFIKVSQKASTSLLQRRFGIGFNRAARIIDTLEDKGMVGPSNGSKPRDVLIKNEDDE